MTFDELDEALLKWGADLDQWPPAQRSAARVLLDTDAAAQALLNEMASFEAGLGAATAMAVDVNGGAISARVQAAIQDRIESAGLLSLLPLRKMLGFGLLAGLGGAAVAVFLPTGADSGLFLAIALGGGAL